MNGKLGSLDEASGEEHSGTSVLAIFNKLIEQEFFFVRHSNI